MSQKSLVVIGSSNTDMVIKIERIPKPGETILGGSFFMNPGGKGANQAVAAARLKGQVTFIAKLGNDIFGQQAKELYQKEGIDIAHLLTDPLQPTGVALINVDKKGENSIAVASGANAHLGIGDIDKSKEKIEHASLLLLQLEIPVNVVEHACEIAHAKGVKIILNPAPAQKLSKSLLQKVNILTPNQSEAELLTGIPVNDLSSAETAGRALLQQGVQACVITLGEDGALICEPGQAQHVKSQKVNALDTTAAGDVFCGALAVALAEDHDLFTAVQFASKAAAISVTRLGAQSSAPYRHEIQL